MEIIFSIDHYFHPYHLYTGKCRNHFQKSFLAEKKWSINHIFFLFFFKKKKQEKRGGYNIIREAYVINREKIFTE